MVVDPPSLMMMMTTTRMLILRGYSCIYNDKADIVVFVCSSLLLGNTQHNDKDEEDITTRIDDTTTRMTVCLFICPRLFLSNKAMFIYYLIFMFISTTIICWTMAMAKTDSG